MSSWLIMEGCDLHWFCHTFWYNLALFGTFNFQRISLARNVAVETSHSLDSLSTQLIVGFLLNPVMQYWTYFGQSWTTGRLILDKAGTTRGGKLWPSASFCSQKRATVGCYQMISFCHWAPLWWSSQQASQIRQSKVLDHLASEERRTGPNSPKAVWSVPCIYRTRSKNNLLAPHLPTISTKLHSVEKKKKNNNDLIR